MIVKFGNLPTIPHSESEPNAKEKVEELMQKLNDAGFIRESNIKKHTSAVNPKSFHIYDLPRQIEFSTEKGVLEAIKIIIPYSKYLKPIALVG